MTSPLATNHKHLRRSRTQEKKTYLALTIGSPMVSHPGVCKFHVRASEGAVLGDTPFHALAPHAE
jgi:hypothetical protein